MRIYIKHGFHQSVFEGHIYDIRSKSVQLYKMATKDDPKDLWRCDAIQDCVGDMENAG